MMAFSFLNCFFFFTFPTVYFYEQKYFYGHKIQKNRYGKHIAKNKKTKNVSKTSSWRIQWAISYKIYSVFVSWAWASVHSARDIHLLLPPKVAVIYGKTYFSGNVLI